MEKSEEAKSDNGKGSSSIPGFIFWPLFFVLIYILSIGPVMMMYEKKRIRDDSVVEVIYTPVGWLYEKSFLHKPLGIYFHLWAPHRYDKKGEWIPRDFD